ncbi:MAG: hypothetical protein WCG83_00015 [Candidatus Peregrinibacteria bacterium]
MSHGTRSSWEAETQLVMDERKNVIPQSDGENFFRQQGTMHEIKDVLEGVSE